MYDANRDPQTREAFVSGILAKMTLDQKIGQCFTIHWGGSMVYGEGYLTEALFPAPAPAPRSAESQLAELAELEASGTTLTVDFATQIMPILEASCIECHGPNKKKGNLRLDSRMYAMDARDADEQVFIPGDAENSEVIWRVTLPLAIPALVSVSIYTLMIAWNEYLYAFVFLNSHDLFTMPIKISTIWNDPSPRPHVVMAASTIMSVPILVLFLALEKYLTEGLSSGGVKG